jgi:2,3-bisphosphoglycerate-independent phosphoglycerate mutase
MNTLPRPKPLVLTILDGWGLSMESQNNAIKAARTPVMDEMIRYFPAAALAAAGLEAGLPAGQSGTSEAGYRNIGTGTVQYQALMKIDRAIADGSFYKNEVINETLTHARQYGSRVHLIGLVSRGGIHSQMDHLAALLRFCRDTGTHENVFIHAITDGRDTPPRSALGYIDQLEDIMGDIGVGRIASVTGRYYAMDRTNDWERTKLFYNMLTGGTRVPGAGNPKQAIQKAYDSNVLDEMIPPTAMTYGGKPLATIKNEDVVVFYNFRADRMRQIVWSLAEGERAPFTTRNYKDLEVMTLVQYYAGQRALAAFSQRPAGMPLAKTLAENGLAQLHLAETDKFVQMTQYFNGGHEEIFAKMERFFVDSLEFPVLIKNPAKAVDSLTDRLLQEIKRGKYDAYIINLANVDMIGHLGNMAATAGACEAADRCLGRIKEALPENGALLVTADHGMAEAMQHSTNPVPLFYGRRELKRMLAKSTAEIKKIVSEPIGILADVAPTMLEILHIRKPAEMSGVSLLSSLR